MLMEVAVLMEQNQVNSSTEKPAGIIYKPSPGQLLSRIGMGQSVWKAGLKYNWLRHSMNEHPIN